MTFKIGDIVTHVLGGPKMQVKTVHSEKLVECFWFDDHGAPHERGFATAGLALSLIGSNPDDSEYGAAMTVDDIIDAIHEHGNEADHAKVKEIKPKGRPRKS